MLYLQYSLCVSKLICFVSPDSDVSCGPQSKLLPMKYPNNGTNLAAYLPDHWPDTGNPRDWLWEPLMRLETLHAEQRTRHTSAAHFFWTMPFYKHIRGFLWLNFMHHTFQLIYSQSYPTPEGGIGGKPFVCNLFCSPDILTGSIHRYTRAMMQYWTSIWAAATMLGEIRTV